MKKNDFIKKIKQLAKRDLAYRRDIRYRTTMGFLVAKGFLGTNEKIEPAPNARIRIQDAIWAGLKVEPRILEVLPAAVVRLPKHFILNEDVPKDFTLVLDDLKKQKKKGRDFKGIPYEKLKVWVQLPLKDKRIKLFDEKKVMKTFRLLKRSAEKLKLLAFQQQLSEGEVIEKLVARETK